MSNFLNAFREGLEAASAARSRRREVHDVLRALRDEVLAGAQGKVRIKLCKLVCGSKLNWKAIDDGVKLTPETVYYRALCAENPLVQDSLVELARWEEGKEGYPCMLMYGGNIVRCGDKAELEQGLRDLISCAEVGEKIGHLMRLEPTNPQPTPAAGEDRLSRVIRRKRTVRVRVPGEKVSSSTKP